MSTSSLPKGFRSTPKALWGAEWTESPWLAKMRCQIKSKVFNYSFRFVNYNLRNVNYSLQPISLNYQLWDYISLAHLCEIGMPFMPFVTVISNVSQRHTDLSERLFGDLINLTNSPPEQP